MNHKIVREPVGHFRKIAREKLKGNWKYIVLATLIYYIVISMIPLLLPYVIGNEAGSLFVIAYYLLISGPATLGYVMFVLRFSRGSKQEYSELFAGFEVFVPALLLGLLIMVFTALWTILLIIPGIIASYRYCLAYYIKADHPEYGANETISKSKDLMLGNKAKRFCLDFSFIGWFLIAAIPAGFVSYLLYGNTDLVSQLAITVSEVGLLWVTSYMMLAQTAFYETIIATDEELSAPMVEGFINATTDTTEETIIERM